MDQEESVMIDISNQHKAAELGDLEMMEQQVLPTSCGRKPRYKRPNADNLTDKLRLKSCQVTVKPQKLKSRAASLPASGDPTKEVTRNVSIEPPGS